SSPAPLTAASRRDDAVLREVQAMRGPPEPERGAGPQRCVAPGGVEIPADAATGGPDRGRHPRLDARTPALERTRPRVQGGGPGPVQHREVTQDVAELGLDDVDHRAMAEPRVGPDHQAQVGEAR